MAASADTGFRASTKMDDRFRWCQNGGRVATPEQFTVSWKRRTVLILCLDAIPGGNRFTLFLELL
jgi:hypothetical protein